MYRAEQHHGDQNSSTRNRKTVLYRGTMRGFERDEELFCHVCDERIEGEPAGHGLLVFPRGDSVLREEPPLCERCALAVSMAAMARWQAQEDDG